MTWRLHDQPFFSLINTSKFREESGIIFVAFFHNAAHMLQPLDITVFHTLK
jgi:hypothetical protein